jgi:hypothetical protein
MIVLLLFLVSCGADPALPNKITSSDLVGTLTLQFPDGWRIAPIPSPEFDRQFITLVRLPDNVPMEQYAQFPAIRFRYDAYNTPPDLETIALSQLSVLQTDFNLININSFNTSMIQVKGYPAAVIRGSDPETAFSYYLMLIDWQPQRGLVLITGSTPDSLLTLEETINAIAETISLTTNLNTPMDIGIVPLATPTVAPESTADPNPESTADPSPESTLEPRPESTLEPTAP